MAFLRGCQEPASRFLKHLCGIRKSESLRLSSLVGAGGAVGHILLLAPPP